MEEFKDEQATVTAQAEQAIAVEKPQDNGANSTEASLGKFKDVNALLTAYNNLQAEFTKRCQKVKELEAQVSAVDKEKSPTETEAKSPISSEEKDDILKSYLKELLSKKQRAIVLDGAGVGVKTPVARPRTFEQAGELAKDLLNKHL